MTGGVTGAALADRTRLPVAALLQFAAANTPRHTAATRLLLAKGPRRPNWGLDAELARVAPPRAASQHSWLSDATWKASNDRSGST